MSIILTKQTESVQTIIDIGNDNIAFFTRNVLGFISVGYSNVLHSIPFAEIKTMSYCPLENTLLVAYNETSIAIFDLATMNTRADFSCKNTLFLF